MLSINQISDQDTDERRKTLEALASRYYKTTRWKTMFANATGINYNTVQQWMIRSTPPAWTILILQAWIDRDDKSIRLEMIKTALEPTSKLI